MSDPQIDLYTFLTNNGIEKEVSNALSEYCPQAVRLRSARSDVDPDNIVDFFMGGPPTLLISPRAAFLSNTVGGPLGPETDASTFRVLLRDMVDAWLAELPKQPRRDTGRGNANSNRNRNR
jgi:hypothetical protein